MSAAFEANSEESIPLGDDQKNQLLPDNASDELKEEEKIKEDDTKLPEKTRHPLDTSLKLFPLHTWLYILYIVLAILLPIFGTLLILCGNYTNTGYFSLFAILNYPFPGLKVEDPNYTASSLEVLQVRFGLGAEVTPSSPAGSSSSGCSPSTWSTPSPSITGWCGRPCPGRGRHGEA